MAAPLSDVLLELNFLLNEAVLIILEGVPALAELFRAAGCVLHASQILLGEAVAVFDVMVTVVLH